MGHLVISEMVIYYLEKIFDSLDTIGNTAPDKITTPCKPGSTRYLSARRLGPSEIKPEANSGFSESQGVFQYTQGYWETTTENAEITFKITARSLALFFGKITSNGGEFELYLDNNLLKKYTCDFKDWEYMADIQIVQFDSPETHYLTIKNVSSAGKRVIISGIGITS